MPQRRTNDRRSDAEGVRTDVPPERGAARGGGRPRPRHDRGGRVSVGAPGGGAAVRHLLDNPTWASLTGPHAHFAERHGNAVRYPDDVSPFYALPDDPGPADWNDLAVLAGPGATVPVAGAFPPPDGWEVVAQGM